MRVGTNPSKNQVIKTSFLHQVIIPVYIPNFEGYFKDALQILDICLQSLIKTVHKKTFITIVNNGSCEAVSNYLQGKLEEKLIQELTHTTNIGKINAINKGIVGHLFRYVTIADADVIFITNWQKATYDVFNSVPKAGIVGLIPQFKMYDYYCSNILFDYFFSSKLRFNKVKNPEAIQQFYQSIGWDSNYNPDFLKMHLTLNGSNGLKCIVGSGHVVSTYNSETSKHFENKYSRHKMGKSLGFYFDQSALKANRYRLTTEDNYAYHMGNVYEPWMSDVLLSLKNYSGNLPENHNKKLNQSYFTYVIKNHLFRKLLEKKWFINWFIKFKGLPKEMAKTPWHE